MQLIISDSMETVLVVSFFGHEGNIVVGLEKVVLVDWMDMMLYDLMESALVEYMVTMLVYLRCRRHT